MTNPTKTLRDEMANPGSEAAIEQGCTCPVMDNARGRGYMGQPGIFVMTAGCPLHGLKAREEPHDD